MRDDTLEHRRDGISNRLIINLNHDADCENPWEERDGSWTLYSFLRNHRTGEGLEKWLNDWVPTIALRKKLSVGLAFALDYYEHGGSVWSIAGTGYRCQWDTSPNAGIMVWENKPGDMGAKSKEDRQKDAETCLTEYNAWANGDCYGFSVETGDGEHLDSCWGFIGPDKSYMFDEIRGSVAHYMEKHEFTRLLEDEEDGDEPDTLYYTIEGDAKWLTDRYSVEPKPALEKAA